MLTVGYAERMFVGGLVRVRLDDDVLKYSIPLRGCWAPGSLSSTKSQDVLYQKKMPPAICEVHSRHMHYGNWEQNKFLFYSYLLIINPQTYILTYIQFIDPMAQTKTTKTAKGKAAASKCTLLSTFLDYYCPTNTNPFSPLSSLSYTYTQYH